MKIDRSWSLDIHPVYDDAKEYFDGWGVFSVGPDTIRYLRVAVKSGGTEVITFHCVKPVHPNTDDPIFSYRAITESSAPFINPFEQLIADAELGRKVREAGLELK
jgi:hypothetical protein